MKKLLFFVGSVLLFTSCNKDEDNIPVPVDVEDTTSTSVEKIDTYDPTITEENADLILSYSDFYHVDIENSANSTLQKTAVLTYLENGEATYFDNKVYLNDTLVDFLFLNGDFGKYRTIFNQTWIPKTNDDIVLELKEGTTLSNTEYTFANVIPDTFDIKFDSLPFFGCPFEFSLSEIPQNTDSIFVSIYNINEDIEILKSFPASVGNSFSFSSDEVDQMYINNYVVSLTVSTTKYLSTNDNGNKIYAVFGSQVDYELPIFYKIPDEL